MPRKKGIQNIEGYNKAFPTRLRKLMEEKNMMQYQLAEKIGKTRQAVSNYCDGSSSPSWETIAEIAKELDCSSDYLLGLSEYRFEWMDDISLTEIGLSNKAAWGLLAYYKSAPDKSNLLLDGLNIMLEDLRFQFICSDIAELAQQVRRDFEYEKGREITDVTELRSPDYPDAIVLTGYGASTFRLIELENLFASFVKQVTGYSELDKLFHEKMQAYHDSISTTPAEYETDRK